MKKLKSNERDDSRAGERVGTQDDKYDDTCSVLNMVKVWAHRGAVRTQVFLFISYFRIYKPKG